VDAVWSGAMDRFVIRNRIVWTLAFVAALALRAAPLTSARPYMSYVDEGNFLHPAFLLIRNGGWTPPQYGYPHLPALLVAACGRLFDSVVRASGRPSPGAQIPANDEIYDELEPYQFLLLARILSVALGLGTVVVAGQLARRMAGPRAGADAALLAAVTPSLVLRGSIASVDGYATLAVLGCAYMTDRMRTAGRPGLTAVGAGVLGGVAFASKYTAVLFLLGAWTTTIFQPARPLEKVRRLALSVLGAAAGATVAMPALLGHIAAVLGSLRVQRAFYGQLPSERSLWEQAIGNAEWTLAYRHPEVGIVFVLLALGGVIVGLRARVLAPTVAGWCVFATTSFLLYGLQVFQPFRNLMPLVALACVAIAILAERSRSSLRAAPWLDAVGACWLVLSFVVPLSAYARSRRAVEDPRTAAVDWVAGHVRPGDDVLFVREFGFLDQELRRVPARAMRRRWEDAEATIRVEQPRFVVTGTLVSPQDPARRPMATPGVELGYEPIREFGHNPTMNIDGWWRSNDERIIVFERKSSG
jgi:hypothetical protein